MNFILGLFTSFKAKLYGIFAGAFIMLLAYTKWQRASNKAKKEKIEKLKEEVQRVKEISKMEADVSTFKGYQKAIDDDVATLERDTESKDDMRRFSNVEENNKHDFTTIRV